MNDFDQFHVGNVGSIRIGALRVVAGRLQDIEQLRAAIPVMPAYADRLEAVICRLNTVNNAMRQVEAELGAILDEHRADEGQARAASAEVLAQLTGEG